MSALSLVVDMLRLPWLLSHHRHRLSVLEPSDASLRLEREVSGKPLYVTPVMVYGMTSGGIIGHTAGVLNALHALGMQPVWVTTDPYSAVRSDIETHVVHPSGRYADIPGAPWFAFNDRLARAARTALEGRKPLFVYQRSFSGCVAGAELARHYRVPFVLEFNSSVASFSQLWAGGVPWRRLLAATEQATLRAADLVVVVSEPLRRQVIGMGAGPDRVLVVPNGVDPDVYAPSVNGGSIRGSLDIADDEFVIGFVGTFYPFHGVEVIADAFTRLLRACQPHARKYRLLLVGTGPVHASVREMVIRSGYADRVVFTGATRQSDGPRHMAACDVLVAPYVPNPDGSAFWNSPVKLFEYMAMGKPIIASRLGQVIDVIEDGQTGVLVQPGDGEELADALAELAGKPELAASLGQAARAAVLARHTWTAHTERILDRLGVVRG